MPTLKAFILPNTSGRVVDENVQVVYNNKRKYTVRINKASDTSNKQGAENIFELPY